MTQGYVKVLDFHLWAGKWGVTLTLVNDWVDLRWHQFFLELMVLSWVKRRYLQVGLSLRLGAVPLVGVMYNRSLLVPGDTRGISLHLLGFSAALRLAPRHFVQDPAQEVAVRENPHPGGVPFLTYDLGKVPADVAKNSAYVRAALCGICRQPVIIPASPWPPAPEAVTAALDEHAATHAGELS